MLTQHIIRTAVEAALAEDAPYGDITCETTIPADETGSAHLTARERGVMSGIAVFTAAFTAQNPGIGVSPLIADGSDSSAARSSPPWKVRYVTCSPPNASPSTSPSA